MTEDAIKQSDKMVDSVTVSRSRKGLSKTENYYDPLFAENNLIILSLPAL